MVLNGGFASSVAGMATLFAESEFVPVVAAYGSVAMEIYSYNIDR